MYESLHNSAAANSNSLHSLNLNNCVYPLFDELFADEQLDNNKANNENVNINNLFI